MESINWCNSWLTPTPWTCMFNLLGDTSPVYPRQNWKKNFWPVKWTIRYYWVKATESSWIPGSWFEMRVKTYWHLIQHDLGNINFGVYVGDKFKMLMNDWRCWWPIYYIATFWTKITDALILSPKSQICHYDKVTNLTLSPTTLSPIWFFWLLWLLKKMWIWELRSLTSVTNIDINLEFSRKVRDLRYVGDNIMSVTLNWLPSMQKVGHQNLNPKRTVSHICHRHQCNHTRIV